MSFRTVKCAEKLFGERSDMSTIYSKVEKNNVNVCNNRNICCGVSKYKGWTSVLKSPYMISFQNQACFYPGGGVPEGTLPT